MKIARFLLAAVLIAPAVPSFAWDVSGDITEARRQRIIAEAKVGQTALRHYAARLKAFNVNIDFDRALEIAQYACMADARARDMDVWQAARINGSACNGWIARTFEPLTKESRESMMAYLSEVAHRRDG